MVDLSGPCSGSKLSVVVLDLSYFEAGILGGSWSWNSREYFGLELSGVAPSPDLKNILNDKCIFGQPPYFGFPKTFDNLSFSILLGFT